MELEATALGQARQLSQPRRIAGLLLRHERLLDESLGLLILGAAVKAFVLANAGFPLATVTAIGLVALLVVSRELIVRRTARPRALGVATLPLVTAVVSAVLAVPWSVQACWLIAIAAGVAGISVKLASWFGPARSDASEAHDREMRGAGWVPAALVDHLVLVLRLAGVTLLGVAVLFALQGIFGS